MTGFKSIFFVSLFLFSSCLADTFIHRKTGARFDGYATSRKKGYLTQVRITRQSPKYLDLNQYQIQRNPLGRKNKIYLFTINDSINLLSETKAFEDALRVACDQGPVFVLIEIDSPGAKPDLAKRISRAIIETDNCNIFAFVGDGRFKGAFSESAIIALSCDRLFMHPQASIGAAGADLQLTEELEVIEPNYTQPIDPNDADLLLSEWKDYSFEIAERKENAADLIKAMFDGQMEIIEVNENGQSLFITPEAKTADQIFIRTISGKGQLLTLTAEQTETSALAEKLFDSRKKLLTYLGARRAALSRDTKMLRAKRAFQRGRRTINKILESIVERRGQVESLDEQIADIERRMTRSNEIFLTERFGLIGGALDRTGTAEIELEQWEDILLSRDELLLELTDALERLLVDYGRAIPIAGRYPDLRYLVGILQGESDNIEGIYNEVRLRYRYRY